MSKLLAYILMFLLLIAAIIVTVASWAEEDLFGTKKRSNSR